MTAVMQKSKIDIPIEVISSCELCGGKSSIVHSKLRDRLFGVEGEWALVRCQQCGYVWLDPRPTYEDIIKVYDGYSSRWASGDTSPSPLRKLKQAIKKRFLAIAYGYAGWGSWHTQLLGYLTFLLPALKAESAREVMYLHFQERGRLLDIGCGSGQFLYNMQQLGWQVEGTDLDPMAQNLARQKGINIRIGNLEVQNYPDDYFDAITMNHVIEHLHYPLKTVQECYRILRPRGRLIVVTPNIESLGHRQFGSDWVHLDPPRHLYLFSLETLKSMIQQSGLQIERANSISIDAYGTWLGSHNIRQTGRLNRDKAPKNVDKIRAHLFWLEEDIRLLLGQKNIGEEILLIAVKERGYGR